MQKEDKTVDKNKEIIFKSCAPFTDCNSEINNTQVDNAKVLDVVMPMCNLVEYRDNYQKTCGSFWQNYRDEPGEANYAAISDSKSFKSKLKIIGKHPERSNAKDMKISVLLKYLNNF